MTVEKTAPKAWMPTSATESPVETKDPDVAITETSTDTTVICTVPKAFLLRIDEHTVLEFKAGVQRMEKAIAKHWYSIANGVTTFEG